MKSIPSSTPHLSLPDSISVGAPRARSSNHLKNWVSSVHSTSQDRDTDSTGMKSIFRFSGKTLSRLDRHRSPAILKRAWIISHFESTRGPKTGDYPRSFLTSHLRTSPMTTHPKRDNDAGRGRTDTMTQSRGTETTGAPARDRGSGLRQ